MFKNYLKIAWRSVMRGRSFSFINICGLAVGMAGATLILLWLFNEVSYERFHINRDRLYKLYIVTDIPGVAPIAIPWVSQPLGPAIKKEFPEVEAFSRVAYTNHFLFTEGDKRFTGVNGAFVDEDFLKMFSFPLAEGSREAQLKDVSGIVITEKMAVKLFGKRDAAGRTIRLDTNYFTVTGVLRDLPDNTEFDFDYLLPISYLKKIGWNNDSWVSNNIQTFLLLKPNTDPNVFNGKIRLMTRKNTGINSLWLHFVYPLDKWHLYSKFENGKPVGGLIDTVRIFAIIAAFILLIACINFMNLSTARSEQRAKEVGIRKVAGAGKWLLIGQFISEAFLTVCVAGVLALLLVSLALPAFDNLIGEKLALPYSSGWFWAAALGFILFTSLLAGSYPAFYLSSFKPVSIFRKKFRNSRVLLSPRKALVVLQFTFAIVLIVSTLIVRKQLLFAEDRDMGYSKNGLIYVDFEGDIEKNYQPLRQELLLQGIAADVTKTWAPLPEGGGRTWTFRWPGMIPSDTNTTIHVFAEDAGLVKTAGMQLVEGRDIDAYQRPSDSLAVLLNQTAVKLMGFKNPIGQILKEPYFNRNWHVVGVVKDYVDASPYEKIPPVVIEGAAASLFQTIHIRFNPGGPLSDRLAKTEAIFKKYNPAYPFDFHFVDQEFAKKYEDAERTRTMAGLFAALAVFISCLGLFGLSAYVAESRVKEIGVRKVLGASATGIARLLSMDFIRLVAVAILIATPVAWYAMTRWLQDFDYRTNIGWETFVLAGLLSVGIALATVSFQAVRAALANPVDSLRAE